MKVFTFQVSPSLRDRFAAPFLQSLSMNPFQPLHIIRVAAGANMLIHGITRISIDGVTPFDGYLGSLGFPPYTAWIITFFEIAGAILLLLNKWTVPLCLLFTAELLMGIVLVHFREGWFVVGAGRNGMEYSVLLIICLLTVVIGKRKQR